MTLVNGTSPKWASPVNLIAPCPPAGLPVTQLELRCYALTVFPYTIISLCAICAGILY